MLLNTFKITVEGKDDRDWSRYRTDEAIDQLIDAGIDEEALQTMLQNIVTNVLMRSDITIKVEEVY